MCYSKLWRICSLWTLLWIASFFKFPIAIKFHLISLKPLLHSTVIILDPFLLSNISVVWSFKSLKKFVQDVIYAIKLNRTTLGTEPFGTPLKRSLQIDIYLFITSHWSLLFQPVGTSCNCTNIWSISLHLVHKIVMRDFVNMSKYL